MARRAKQRVEIACRRCRSVRDVTGMKPGALIVCEACGARNRVPRRSGPPLPLVLAGVGGLAVVVLVIAVASSGGGPEPAPPAPEPVPAPAPAPEPAPEPKAEPAPAPPPKPEPDPVDIQYERLAAAARKDDATAADAFKVAEFCRGPGRRKYRSEMRKWAELAVARNPRHEWAHELLGQVEFLGDWISEAEKEKRLAEPWFKKAWEVRERKFLQDQQLRDLGLVYHAACPFVIAKERNDSQPIRDARELEELGAILQGTYRRFRELFAERARLPAFDGSDGEARAIPVFWFDSEKSFRRAWSQVRGLKRDVSEFAAAFYAPGDENELMEMMIYGYRDRDRRDRTFDNGKIAHEATHALEDYYRRPVGKLEMRDDSGTWWFSEGLAEFIGSVQVKAVDDPGRPGGRRFEVTFLDRNKNRWDTARRMLKSSMRFHTRAVFDDANIGLAGFGRLEQTEARDWPFALADLIDLRNGADLDARAAVMFSGVEEKQMARALQGLVGSLAYFEGWALVAFLYESGGEYRETLMRAYEARRNNKPHATVNAVAFKGLDLNKLEKEWLAWVSKVLETR